VTEPIPITTHKNGKHDVQAGKCGAPNIPMLDADVHRVSGTFA
jgi:hypothetical protein